MKNLIPVLFATVVLAGCAAAPKEVIHSEHGTMDASDDLYKNDFENCAWAYADTQATTEEEKAEVRAERTNKKTLSTNVLAGTIAMGIALGSNTESTNYVRSCMKDKGWEKL